MDAAGTGDAAHRRRVLQACRDALAQRGFVRFGDDGVDAPLANGFHCWVGLDAGIEHGHLHVTPFVGVHVAPIEQLLSRLKHGRDTGSDQRSQATCAIPMAMIVPDEHRFRFTPQTDVIAEAERLASLYVTIGLPYARSLASYPRLLPLLRDHTPIPGADPERAAICLYLMDRRDEARAFVENVLKRAPDHIEGFAEPFLTLLAG